MSKRTRVFGAWLAACLGVTLSGCEEPPLIPAVPPGQNPRESLVPKEEGDNAAQALGESAAHEAAAKRPTPAQNVPLAEPTAKGEVKTTESGVKYETLQEGTGDVAKPGKQVSVLYVGKLDDGRTFDSTKERDKPYAFPLGLGKVIRGWDEAVPGMRVGEKRKLTIPPSAGYGALGFKPTIPPNATLHFEVELLKVE
jgi:FKBP-type peptidyl-prolyl cis-trans isomerase